VAQSLSRILVHLVFSTKNREPTVHSDLRQRLHAYLVGCFRNLECPSLQTGGTADHVHALLMLSRTASIADVAEQLKKSSSKWMKQQGVATFAWQAGYGAFSIGESQVPALVRYIVKQEEHHRRVTFQDELRRLLNRYNVTYDERYVWE
jgi:REP element-mobilizing transposase RayT